MLIDVDISLDMEKHMISLPSSIYGRITFIAVSIDRMAAEELDAEDKVTVIDSRNLSTGIGLLVVEAAVMAADGKSREEIKTGIDELIPKVRASFVVDTLVYLYRGGRCNAVSALVGGALALHPMIVVKDGKMDASRKYRGKIGKVIKNYDKRSGRGPRKTQYRIGYLLHIRNVMLRQLKR